MVEAPPRLTPHWLCERMALWPDRVAMVRDSQKATYAELLELVSRWQSYFVAIGLRPGQTVVVRGDFTPTASALLLALIQHRATLIPLTRETAAQHEELFTAAGAEVVLSQHREPQTEVPSPAPSWARAFAGAVSGEHWHAEHRSVSAPHPLIARLRAAETPGLIAFTSGSSGKPKAILHDFAKFMHTYREQRRSLCTITFLSFDHLGGINTLLYALSSGSTMVALRARDPETVCRAIADHRVELLPTSPTFLKLLLISEAYKRHDLSSLKMLTYGTEVMPESTLQQLREVLPAVRLQQTYAFSEGPPLRLKSREEGSLWIKIGGEGIETKVVDGQLWVRTQSAMMGYLNTPSPFAADGWLNTGDMVEVEGEYLRILGRKSEIINVGGEKVFPAEVEDVILQLANIKDVVVKGKSSPIVGNIVTATVNLNHPEDRITVEQRVRAFCQSRLPAFKVPAIVRVAEQALHNERFKKIRTAN